MIANLPIFRLCVAYVYNLVIRANAKLVYACEWNPHAVEALRHNLHANSVMERCIILEGDNRIVAPKVCTLTLFLVDEKFCFVFLFSLIDLYCGFFR